MSGPGCGIEGVLPEDADDLDALSRVSDEIAGRAAAHGRAAKFYVSSEPAGESPDARPCACLLLPGEEAPAGSRVPAGWAAALVAEGSRIELWEWRRLR